MPKNLCLQKKSEKNFFDVPKLDKYMLFYQNYSYSGIKIVSFSKLKFLIKLAIGFDDYNELNTSICILLYKPYILMTLVCSVWLSMIILIGHVDMLLSRTSLLGRDVLGYYK